MSVTATSAVRFQGVDLRRAVAFSLPIVMPAAMTALFTAARRRFGDDRGYVAGFAAYWATCGGLSVALLGRRPIWALLADRRPRLGPKRIIGAALLAWPPLGAIATRFIPEVGQATPAMLATIVGVAVANAMLEELLWRGVYVTLWPANPVLGWLWPAVGFGLWHRAPQVIHRSSMGPLAYVASATALGVSWGWVAWSTGSLRWVAVSHVLTDGSGVSNARFFLGQARDGGGRRDQAGR